MLRLSDEAEAVLTAAGALVSYWHKTRKATQGVSLDLETAVDTWNGAGQPTLVKDDPPEPDMITLLRKELEGLPPAKRAEMVDTHLQIGVVAMAAASVANLGKSDAAETLARTAQHFTRAMYDLGGMRASAELIAVEAREVDPEALRLRFETAFGAAVDCWKRGDVDQAQQIMTNWEVL